MRQDTRLGLTAAAAALGTAGGALALYGLGVPFALGALALAAAAGLAVRAALLAGVRSAPPAGAGIAAGPPGGSTPDAAYPADAAQAERMAMLEAMAKTLRHDLRGALSPALMVTDRLLAHPDPAIARAGQAVLRSVTRATEMLDATRPPPTNPPG